MDDWNQKVWDLVACIPEGSVATYGQLAEMLGFPRRARHVGFALKRTPDGLEIPWFRVVNGSGGISLPSFGTDHIEQRIRLEREGVVFNQSGRINLKKFRWRP